MEKVKDVLPSMYDGKSINQNKAVELFPNLQKYLVADEEVKEIENIITVALLEDMTCEQMVRLKAYNDWVCDLEANKLYTVTKAFNMVKMHLGSVMSYDDNGEYTPISDEAFGSITDEQVLEHFIDIMAAKTNTPREFFSDIYVRDTEVGKCFINIKEEIAPLVLELIN